MKEIVINIEPDGEVNLAPQGYKGTECKDATKFLEETLGKISDVKYTSDYREQNVSTSAKNYAKN